MQKSIGNIEALLTPVTDDLGFELVRVSFGGQGRPTLQVMAERADGSGMTVEDCTRLSREISALLDVEDPIKGEYVLEVSSPGIDRPLTRPKDFDRFAGFEAKMELKSPIGNSSRLKGTLKGLDGDDVIIVTDAGETLQTSVDNIQKAKLVLTDALLEAHAAKAKAAQDQHKQQ